MSGTYEFDLTFEFFVQNTDAVNYVDAIYAENFDDVLVSHGTMGKMGIAIRREGDSFFSVLKEAIALVVKAVPECRLVDIYYDELPKDQRESIADTMKNIEAKEIEKALRMRGSNLYNALLDVQQFIHGDEWDEAREYIDELLAEPDVD